MSGSCSLGWTISSQEDVDSISNELIECTQFPFLLLENATGKITFPETSFPETFGPVNITVTESDALESLNITSFCGVQYLDMFDLSIIEGLYLPNTPNNECQEANLAIRIQEHLKDPKDVFPHNLHIHNAPPFTELVIEYNTPRSMVFRDITEAKKLTISNAITYFPALKTASSVSLLSDTDKYDSEIFKNLSQVASIDIAGVGYEFLLDYDFEVWDDMTITSFSHDPQYGFMLDENGKELDSLRIPSIGKDLIVRDGSNVPLSFTNLTTIGANLVFADSRNCSLSFRDLTEVPAIWMSNNTNTTLPGNMDKLEFANDIYLNGYIDT